MIEVGSGSSLRHRYLKHCFGQSERCKFTNMRASSAVSQFSKITCKEITCFLYTGCRLCIQFSFLLRQSIHAVRWLIAIEKAFLAQYRCYKINGPRNTFLSALKMPIDAYCTILTFESNFH